MRGRHPVGPELVDRLAGSDEARRRAKVVLQTMTGQLRVREACALLGICEQRFEMIRREAVQGAVASLEPRPVGRPPRVAADESDDVARLRERVAELEAELTAARVRAELAAALPRVSSEPGKR